MEKSKMDWSKMYSKLEIYVPATHAEAVKDAVFRAGAGALGRYRACCWQTTGIGQFEPLEGSSPFLGEPGALERVEEVKIEVLCPTARMPEIIRALREAHPYETPAFQYWPVQIGAC